MAWQDRYPFAYHVFPLHLARDISEGRALLSKKQRAASGKALARPTTAAVDAALGFDDVVHFYLPKAGTLISDLPILRTQLQPALEPPFPHAVFRIPTTFLRKRFFVCCWNIAVSRPQSNAAGVKGGNWARGTSAERIAGVWDAFREERPDVAQARGYWFDGKRVPLLSADQVETNRALLRLPKGGPELLVESRVVLEPPISVVTFCDHDQKLLERSGISKSGIVIHRERFPGYGDHLDATAATYTRIERYLAGDRTVALDFDRVRRSRPR